MDANILVDKLNGFETEDDIANFLRQQGVRGWVQDEHACVISNWISQETGKQVTTSDTIDVFEDHSYDSAESFETSKIVKSFIDAFDNGAYEDLQFECEDFE